MTINIVMAFLIIFCIVLMSFITPFTNWGFHNVNTELFTKIKIKKCAWLFKGSGGKHSIYGDVKHYGIIKPMFILHILGYILSLLSIITALIMLFVFNLDLITTAITIASILGFESIILAITKITCLIISKKVNQK